MSFDIAISTEKETQVIHDGIVAFNKTCVPFTQNVSFVPLNFHIQDENSLVIAGITSLLYCWGMLYVDVLFVEEKHRGKKLGTRLLSYVEAKAVSMGASLSHLDKYKLTEVK